MTVLQKVQVAAEIFVMIVKAGGERKERRISGRQCRWYGGCHGH